MSTAFRIVLEGSQQVPPVASSASGVGYAIFDSTANSLSYEMTVQGLDFGPYSGAEEVTAPDADNVNGAHFHQDPPGENGPIILEWLDDDDFSLTPSTGLTRTISGNWSAADTPSITNFINLFTANGVALGEAIDVYANIHTVAHGGGELRGQLILISTDNSETVTGTEGVDFLPALNGDDTVNALGGADWLDGGAGNDVLNGGIGADAIEGGLGNDMMYVDNAADTATEDVNAGTDTVIASRSWAVASNIEKVTLSGSGDFNVAGNGLANTLRGNSGDNWLNGSFGKDTLTGGGGRDSFIFNRALGPNNIDTITDYDVVRDVIRIDNAIFTGIGANGALAAGAFRTGSAATQDDDRIIYDSTNGRLYFDVDGVGGTAQVHFATLSTHPTGMSASEFIII